MEHFIRALKENKEEKKIDELYKETIDLYSKKKCLSFLIELFIKIYQKKDICSILLTKFKEINENMIDNNKNMDKKSYLKIYLSEFIEIKSIADKLVVNNNYNIIEFYGILLYYFNYYDYNNFSSIINDLLSKQPNALYEILLIYKADFKYLINQNFLFYNEFIKYIINKNKEFSIFENGLYYISDIETFIKIIEINKEEIYNKYTSKNNNYIIRLDDNLTLEKMENLEENNSNLNKDENEMIFKIVNNIESIISFSKYKETFIIYFTNNFWKYMLNNYMEPKIDNIKICFKLREIFFKYYDLVIEIFKEKDKKEFTIKKEVINYFEIDEFAFVLDRIIKNYINIHNKELLDIEKLGFITTKYNPYYRESKYGNIVDSGIFDLFDLNNIDDEFIDNFRKMNFEKIFKFKIDDYINKIISKIKCISDFEKIIKLINIENLEQKKYISKFFE